MFRVPPARCPPLRGGWRGAAGRSKKLGKCGAELDVAAGMRAGRETHLCWGRDPVQGQHAAAAGCTVSLASNQDG